MTQLLKTLNHWMDGHLNKKISSCLEDRMRVLYLYERMRVDF